MSPEPGTSLSTDDHDGAVAERGSFRLVVDPVFGTFFWGKVLSAAGIWIYNIVAIIVAYEVSGSALIVGLVSVAQFAPQLGLAMLAGKMADRGNAPAQIIVGRLICALGAGLLAAAIIVAGGVDQLPHAWPVLASAMIVGLGFVVGGPAMQSLIPEMVRPGELPAAMALNSAPMTFARAAGPAVGALVATQLGPVTAFLIAAATNVAFAVALFIVRLPKRPAPTADADLSVLAALRYLRVDPALLLLLVGVGAVGFATEPAITLAPALADDLGGGSGLVGWLTSAFGIGSAIGFVLFTTATRMLGLTRLITAGLIVMGTGLALAALVGIPWFVLGALGLSGIGMMVAFTAISTQLQQRSPADLRGRIMALWMIGFLGARPFAAALDGFLADVASVQVALLVSAGIAVVAAYCCRPRRLAVPSPLAPVPAA